MEGEDQMVLEKAGDLDVLPDGSVVLDSHGLFVMKREGCWFCGRVEEWEPVLPAKPVPVE